MAMFTGTSGSDTIVPGTISTGVTVDPPGSDLSGNDTLLGLESADTLDGGAGDDIVNGGLGADAMSGGMGDDRFLVDNVGDTVTENVGEGVDTVVSSIDYTLPENVERLTLIGSGDIDGVGTSRDNIIVGNDGANVLDGLGGYDRLLGYGGDDLLRGGSDADVMVGGTGDDRYLVNEAGDAAVELPGEGLDTVVSSVTYSLEARTLPGGLIAGANIERLTLTGGANIDGTGNSEDNLINGNSGANRLNGLTGDDRLVGDAGDDTLDGGTGADEMVGGAGNDRYIVDNVGDSVIERSGEGDSDTVNATIDYTLVGAVERLTLLGSADLDGAGNSLDNVINGNSGDNELRGNDGDDRLLGNGGDDVLVGGVGNDVMTGGSGNDTFVFANTSDSDRILDFDADPSGGQDLLDVSAFGWTDFTDMINDGTTITDSGSNVVIDFGGSAAQVELVGVSSADLNGDDFLFT